MSNSKIYIAGPMSGIPSFNYPAFDEAAGLLRRKGYDVLSPAEMDDPETRAAAMASPDGAFQSGTCNGETWGDFLSRDVKIVADECDGVLLLNGWQKSRGARLEAFIAITVQKPLYILAGDAVVQRATGSTLKTIVENLLDKGRDESRYGT